MAQQLQTTRQRYDLEGRPIGRSQSGSGCLSLLLASGLLGGLLAVVAALINFGGRFCDARLQRTNTDPSSSLAPSGVSTLQITTHPPRTAVAGEPLSYLVEVAGANGNTTFSLVEGPAGMELSRVSGHLTWMVPPELPLVTRHVVVLEARTTSGQLAEQRFGLLVLGYTTWHRSTGQVAD